MSQIFHPSMNAFAKATIFGALLVLAALVWLGGDFSRSPYMTGVGVVRDQPVPFSHDHHVGGLGIDCRYCHTSVETSAFAGVPTTEICMGCHSQIWKDSPMLAPVRESYRTGKPLAWTRVNDVPDFVYFNHAIHVAKGVACQTCHGPVNQMPLMWQSETLHMQWCLDCHTQPEKFVRPRDEVYAFWPAGQRDADRGAETDNAHADNVHTGEAHGKGKHDHGRTSNELSDDKLSDGQLSDGPALVAHYGIATRQLADCTICHR